MKIYRNSSQGIQLISAPRDQDISPISRSGAYQPLGLLSIGSYLLKYKICASVDILDGEFLDVSEICSHLTSGYVGISCTTASYMNALNIAQAAKARGATVVLGGSHATALGKTILKNQPEVDFAVRGEGEVAFSKLVSGVSPVDIANLVYRQSNIIIENPIQLLPLHSLPTIRRDLIPFKQYIERYSIQPSAVPNRVPAAIYSQKGCMWRYKSGGCLFCGRLDNGWRSRPVQQVWREIIDMNQNYGANYIWDVSDSFTSSREWVLNFAASRPSEVDIQFFLYARANELDEEIVNALYSIGCKELFIGVESGDDSLLHNANKGTTISDNLRAAYLLASKGIRMFPCFIFGLL